MEIIIAKILVWTVGISCIGGSILVIVMHTLLLLESESKDIKSHE